MPKVYTGKVVIPGDKIEEYLEMLKKAEEKRKPFVDKCEAILDEFYDYLVDEKGLSERTANSYYQVIHIFNEFLARQTDVWDYSEVTRGIVNTYFKQWYKRKVWGGQGIERIPVSIKKFFLFLKEKKGIHNKKILGK
ncbi:MAG: site-specific integrase [Thermoplasmatales archaeon]|nr:site-specific integrase [Thermoplasmatales archaeon]